MDGICLAVGLPKLLWILQILCALGIIIWAHELGHFLTAKRFGMKVHEFAIGGGPAVFKWERRGTLYSLRPYFPFMGFVRIAGLEGEEGAEAVPGSFHQQSLGRRMIVLGAGALMNILGGGVLFCIIYGAFGVVVGPTNEVAYVAPDSPAPLKPGDRLVAVNGVREEPLTVLDDSLARKPTQPVRLTFQRQGRERTVTVTPKVRKITYAVTYPDRSQKVETERVGHLGIYWQSGITSRIEWVRPGSPAERAGLQRGDQIIAINGEWTTAPGRIQEIIQDHAHRPVRLRLRRKGQEIALTVTPGIWQSSMQDANYDLEEDGTIVRKEPLVGQMGVAFQAARKRLSLGESILQGGRESLQWIIMAPIFIYKMISGKAPREVGGPVRLVQELYTAASYGPVEFLQLVALLSFNIALFNLLPLPALDGGRILLLVIEGLRRKPLDRRREALFHFVGMVALLALILILSISEIRALIQGIGM